MAFPTWRVLSTMTRWQNPTMHDSHGPVPKQAPQKGSTSIVVMLSFPFLRVSIPDSKQLKPPAAKFPRLSLLVSAFEHIEQAAIQIGESRLLLKFLLSIIHFHSLLRQICCGKTRGFLAEIMMILKIHSIPKFSISFNFNLQFSIVFHQFTICQPPFFFCGLPSSKAGRPHWPSAQRFATASAMGVAAIRGDFHGTGITMRVLWDLNQILSL